MYSAGTLKGMYADTTSQGIKISTNFPSPINPYAKNPRQLKIANTTIMLWDLFPPRLLLPASAATRLQEKSLEKPD